MSGKEYRTITDVKGPLVFLNKTEPVSFGEIVQLRLSDGSMKNGQVLDTSDDQVIVQVFEGTASVDRQTGVKFLGDVFKLPVSKGLIGRILDGAGRPRDGGPEIVADEMADIIGAAINPYSRQSPESFIQPGISAIDACTSLVEVRSYQFSVQVDCRTTISHCRLQGRPSLWAVMTTSLSYSVRWESPRKSTTSSFTIWRGRVPWRMQHSS